MTMHGLTSIPVDSNLMSDRVICANHCLSMASTHGSLILDGVSEI